MCGGTAQTTQQVSIPPDVMARYNAVNARAEQVAQKPFQQYSTDPNAFVAPINQTQQAAISNIGNAQNIAQPYFQGATEQLMGAQGAATPYYGQATQQLMGGLAAGMAGTQAAYQPMAQAAQYAQGLQGRSGCAASTGWGGGKYHFGCCRCGAAQSGCHSQYHAG